MPRLIVMAASVLMIELLTLFPSPIAIAQLPKGNPKNLGVDSIKTSERQLYGFVIGRQPDGTIECAVDRAWLLATYPDLVAEIDRQADSQIGDLKQIRIDRLKAWISERGKDEHIRLRLFLEGELERLETYQPEAQKAAFVLITVEPAKLVRLINARPEQRHIAGVAYQHDLKDVSITPTGILERRLKEKGIDPKAESFDLSNRLPRLTRETERQWAIRQALVEYDVLEPVELQGKGSLLMGAGDRPDPFALLKEMSTSEGLEIFKELSKEMRLNVGSQVEKAEQDQWRQLAIGKAEKKGSRGALVLRLKQDVLSGIAKVSATFMVKDADGNWFDAYHSTHENDGSQATKEELDRLRQDPSIQRILPMIEAVGGVGQIEKALRHGAATNLAMGEARTKFSEYKNPFSRDILSPAPPEPIIK